MDDKKAGDYSDIRWATSSLGAERNGEWLVSIEIILLHGRSVYILFCSDGEMVLSRSHSI
jgi:hypothetical protein